jgi:hypothetical protein
MKRDRKFYYKTYYRLKHNWLIEEALMTPVRKWKGELICVAPLY